MSKILTVYGHEIKINLYICLIYYTKYSKYLENSLSATEGKIWFEKGIFKNRTKWKNLIKRLQ